MQWQWDLSTSYDRIGDALIAGGKLKEALAQLSPQPRDRRDAGPARSRDTRAGNGTWPSATTRSARSRPSAIPSEARELLEKGRAIIARLAGIAAYQAQWRSDLSRFDEVLKSLDG